MKSDLQITIVHTPINYKFSDLGCSKADHRNCEFKWWLDTVVAVRNPRWSRFCVSVTLEQT